MDTRIQMGPSGPFLFLVRYFFFSKEKEMKRYFNAHLRKTKPLFLFFFVAILSACGGSTQEEITNDSMPVVKPPEAVDTTRVITPPPTGDSNVVHPDSSVESR